MAKPVVRAVQPDLFGGPDVTYKVTPAGWLVPIKPVLSTRQTPRKHRHRQGPAAYSWDNMKAKMEEKKNDVPTDE